MMDMQKTAERERGAEDEFFIQIMTRCQNVDKIISTAVKLTISIDNRPSFIKRWERVDQQEGRTLSGTIASRRKKSIK